MENVKWPEGKKSAAMFSFDLDGDVIWRNMSADEPNAKELIRARSIGQYWIYVNTLDKKSRKIMLLF